MMKLTWQDFKVHISISLVVFILGFAVSCEPMPLDPLQDLYITDFSNDIGNENYVDAAAQDSIFILSMKRRAQRMTYLQWTPKGTVPHGSSPFKPGKVVYGIPYSSVKELDKFVGIDVSFHTFMTAVNNPRSVLYTEDISKSPYNGTNCSTYYGTVCSAAVCYVLGIDYPWSSSSMANSLPHFVKNEDDSPFAIEEGDFLWKPGHAALVYEIERNSVTDSLEFVSIFEAVGSGTRIIKYDTEKYLARWRSDNLVDYKYVLKSKSKEYKPTQFYAAEGEEISPFEYNNDLCPQLGDRAVYREGEDIVINMLNDSYHILEVQRDGFTISTNHILGEDVVISSLDCGRYFFYARDTLSGMKSLPVSVDVVDADVSINKIGKSYKVMFRSSYAQPVYVAICNANGGKMKSIELSKDDIYRGYIVLEIPNAASEYYCKVYFETEWGRVTNNPIKL